MATNSCWTPQQAPSLQILGICEGLLLFQILTSIHKFKCNIRPLANFHIDIRKRNERNQSLLLPKSLLKQGSCRLKLFKNFMFLTSYCISSFISNQILPPPSLLHILLSSPYSFSVAAQSPSSSSSEIPATSSGNTCSEPRDVDGRRLLLSSSRYRFQSRGFEIKKT